MPLHSIEPKIIDLTPMQLAGIRMETSLARNDTPTLWQRFLPPLKELENRIGDHLISLQEYPEDYFKSFQPDRPFTKWALAQVSAPTQSNELENISVHGLYAVFTYRGQPAEFGAAIQQIFTRWLPKTDYELDHRPHFEWLGDKYKHNDPLSEEEIWIPVRRVK